MDSLALKIEIKHFREKVDGLIIAINRCSTSIAYQEIDALFDMVNKLSALCESCHNSLYLLFTDKSFVDEDHLAAELWNLTKVFEYVRRKYEVMVLTQKRRVIDDV